MRFILGTICTALLCSTLFAAEGHARVSREGYTFRNGKVMMLKEGKETAVTTEVTLHNGARLLPDGVVIFKDGRRERFPEARLLTLEGEFVAFDADVVPSTEVVEEEYYLEGDKVYVIHDNIPTLLSIEVTLSNGSRLEPDGTIITREGTRSRLSAGQRIAKSGKIVERSQTQSRTARDVNAQTQTQTQPTQPGQTQPTQPQTTQPGHTQPSHNPNEPAHTPAAQQPQTPTHPAQPRTGEERREEKHENK